MVERWLQQLEHQMIVSLRDVGTQAHVAYPVSVREEWVLAWPGQIVQAGSCVQYTTEVLLMPLASQPMWTSWTTISFYKAGGISLQYLKKHKLSLLTVLM